MFNKKSVTPKKVAANCANAKFSTGPRTDRGKQASQINALKFGFFSKELIIPLCDGEGASEEYESLINGLEQYYQPVGFMERWWVNMIAECMWRLRRARRAEGGSSLVNLWDAQHYQKDSLWALLVATVTSEQSKLAVLDTAWEEIQQTGMLSAATYANVAPLLGDQGQTAVKPPESEKNKENDAAGTLKTPESKKSKESDSAGAPKTPESGKATEGNPAIDDNLKRRLEKQRFLLQLSVQSKSVELKKGVVNAAAKCALPPTPEMNKVLRYENRILKRLDWAFKGFDECQKRRKKAQSPL